MLRARWLRHCARYAQSSSDSSQHCRGKIPQKLNKPRFVFLSHFLSSIILIVQHSRHGLSLFFIHRVILSTDYHRFTQILNIKDILIITDFLLGTEIHGFIFNKGTAWLRIDKTRHFVITARFASSCRFVTFRESGLEECCTFAFEKRSQAALGNIKQAYIALACTDIAV